MSGNLLPNGCEMVNHHCADDSFLLASVVSSSVDSAHACLHLTLGAVDSDHKAKF